MISYGTTTVVTVRKLCHSKCRCKKTFSHRFVRSTPYLKKLSSVKSSAT